MQITDSPNLSPYWMTIANPMVQSQLATDVPLDSYNTSSSVNAFLETITEEGSEFESSDDPSDCMDYFPTRKKPQITEKFNINRNYGGTEMIGDLEMPADDADLSSEQCTNDVNKLIMSWESSTGQQTLNQNVQNSMFNNNFAAIPLIYSTNMNSANLQQLGHERLRNAVLQLSQIDGNGNLCSKLNAQYPMQIFGRAVHKPNPGQPELICSTTVNSMKYISLEDHYMKQQQDPKDNIPQTNKTFTSRCELSKNTNDTLQFDASRTKATRTGYDISPVVEFRNINTNEQNDNIQFTTNSSCTSPDVHTVMSGNSEGHFDAHLHMKATGWSQTLPSSEATVPNISYQLPNQHISSVLGVQNTSLKTHNDSIIHNQVPNFYSNEVNFSNPSPSHSIKHTLLSEYNIAKSSATPEHHYEGFDRLFLRNMNRKCIQKCSQPGPYTMCSVASDPDSNKPDTSANISPIWIANSTPISHKPKKQSSDSYGSNISKNTGSITKDMIADLKPLHRSPAVLGVSDLLTKTDDELKNYLKRINNASSTMETKFVPGGKSLTPLRRNSRHYDRKQIVSNDNTLSENDSDLLDRRSFYDYGYDDEDDDVDDDDDVFEVIIPERYYEGFGKTIVYPPRYNIDEVLYEEVQNKLKGDSRIVWSDSCDRNNLPHAVPEYATVCRREWARLEGAESLDLPYIDCDAFNSVCDYKYYRCRPTKANLDEVTLNSRSSHILNSSSSISDLSRTGSQRRHSKCDPCGKHEKPIRTRSRREFQSCDNARNASAAVKSSTTSVHWLRKLCSCVGSRKRRS